MAVRGDLARPPAAPLILASTSPQRHAILEQLRIPFDAVAPRYVEEGDDPVEHAAGKARSVDGGDRPVLVLWGFEPEGEMPGYVPRLTPPPMAPAPVVEVAALAAGSRMGPSWWR